MTTIEDIDYLEHNSELNYKNLLIDSSYRNLKAHPYPNYYSINLQYPIFNVVNIKADGLFLPNGSTTINKYNRTLIYRAGFLCTRTRLNRTLYIKIKDYVAGDYITLVNSDDYNIATLLAQKFITVETYLNSDTYNGDANYALFRSSMPFVLDMEQSTCNKAYGFTELAEDTYDLDLYPNKIKYGLYKRDNVKSDRIFVSYPTNYYNETTKYITKTTKKDAYNSYGFAVDKDVILARGDPEDTTLNIYNEETFSLGYQSGGFLFTNFSDYIININNDDSTFTLSQNESVYQSITINPEQLINFNNTQISSSYDYTIILKKIRLYINSNDYNDNESKYNTINDKKLLTWTLYECFNESTSLTVLNTANIDNNSSNYSFFPYSTDNRINTQQLETEIKNGTYIHEVLSGSFEYNLDGSNNLFVTIKDAYPSTATSNIYLNNNPSEYIGGIKLKSDVTNISDYIDAYQPTKYFVLKVTNTSEYDIVLDTQYQQKTLINVENNRIYSSIQDSVGNSDDNYYYQLKLDMKLHVLENSVNNNEPKMYYKDHMLISPNVVSFLSSKYIKLRCLEIENMVDDTNLSTGNFSPGIAIISTRSLSKVYNDISTNFYSIDYKNFHPIGKLTRLTFKFEDDSGNLVDFQGLDHYFTLLITYKHVISKTKFSKSILNPNYDGNFINHLKYKEEREETIASLPIHNPRQLIDKEQELMQKFEQDFKQFRKQQILKNNIFNDPTINYKNEIINNPNQMISENFNNNSDSEDSDE